MQKITIKVDGDAVEYVDDAYWLLREVASLVKHVGIEEATPETLLAQVNSYLAAVPAGKANIAANNNWEDVEELHEFTLSIIAHLLIMRKMYYRSMLNA